LKNIYLFLLLFCPGFHLLQGQGIDSLTAGKVMIPAQDSLFVLRYNPDGAGRNEDFEPGKIVGTAKSFNMYEVSGVAASFAYPGSVWVHEDSQKENVIALLNASAQRTATLRLTGIPNLDWEDIAVAPGPKPGIKYIYLAEIGDNLEIFPFHFIYRFPEPVLIPKAPPPTTEIKNSIDRIQFIYPDGKKNAEAFLIDPQTLDLYIFAKGGSTVVYVAPYPQPVNQLVTLKKVGILPLSQVTSAAISPDGREVLIKTYDDIFYWKKTGSETFLQLLQTLPLRVPYTREPQGEAVGWATDGSGYFTISELAAGVEPVLYFYKRKTR
jgi:hypothetical protein